jgi:hypothetical protein
MEPKKKNFYINLGRGGVNYLVDYINTNYDEITFEYLDNKLNETVITHDKLDLENVISYLSDYDKFINHYGNVPRNTLMPNLSSLENPDIRARIKNLLLSDLLGKVHAVYRDLFFKGLESFIFEMKRKGRVSWAYLYHPEFGEYLGDYNLGDFKRFLPRIKELINEWFFYIEGASNYPGTSYNHPDDYEVNNLEFKFIVDEYAGKYSDNKENLMHVINELIHPEYLDTFIETKNLIYLGSENMKEIIDIYSEFLRLLIFSSETIDYKTPLKKELMREFGVMEIGDTQTFNHNRRVIYHG